MKITVEREKLLKALQRIISTVGSRSTLPVLGNVLLETQGDTLVLTTTDLEIRITTSVPAKVDREGKTTLPAKKLLALISKFSDPEVRIDSDERHHAEIVCGTSKFKLLGIAPADFPLPVEFTPVRELKFKGADLKRMVGQIIYAASLDDSRMALHGILIALKEHLVSMVATDGKRLALVERAPEEFAGTDGNAIVPLRAAGELRRLVEGDDLVSLEIGEKQAGIRTGDTHLTTKLIEGNYPNYRQVIPATFARVLDVPTIPFLQKIELVSQVLSNNSSFVTLTFDQNQLQIQASSSEVGEGRAQLSIDYADEKVDTSFNPAFLLDPLRCSEAEAVKVKINDGFSPVAIEGGEGFLYIIMPMRNH